jgi:tetratricopeptide (TPR) repeat protein
VNLPQARQLAQKAVDLSPAADNYFMLGWACYANKDDGAAKTALERALSLDPKNAAYARCYRTVLERGELK